MKIDLDDEKIQVPQPSTMQATDVWFHGRRLWIACPGGLDARATTERFNAFMASRMQEWIK